MADYGVEPNTNGTYGEDEDNMMYGEENKTGEYNDYGAEENPMEVEGDIPVTQEDAWAVISWVFILYNVIGWL